MDAQELRNLQEAYMEVVENQQLDEAMSSYDRNRKRAAQRAAERNAARDRGQTGAVPGVGYVTPRRERETYTDSAGVERHKSGARMPKKEDQKESFDFFDVILEHLVAEGYADTNEAALAIMANMSKEWKQSIVEEMLDEGKKEFPFKKVSKKAAGHEMDFIKRGSPESGRRARKMKAIASTVEVGGDPRKTMHGQDLRKM